MEILAVLLVIAVVASFLVPAVRAVRGEVYYHQAKTAALKMAEAMRSYYRDSRGYVLTGSVTGTSNPSFETNCPTTSPVRTGIVTTSTNKSSLVDELFECNYLSWKDFQGLPYTFTPSATSSNRDTLVTFTASSSDKKTGRYKGKSFHVRHNMTVDDEDD